ncbi:MAG TPA: hypothetical protein VGW36_03205 [Pyrinomonadaceae bacterium]|nr:hypothetical protein [Pyrinomonadaceae bacterium]
MHLVQILLPLYDNNKQPFTRDYFDSVHAELTEKFGGVTAFIRSPAIGFWKEAGDDITRDDVVMFEVMTEELDEAWWASHRQTLEEKFKQEELVIRALTIIML